MGIIKQLFRSGKSGREREVDRLYELYKAPFVSFLRKQYGIDEETALDLYQDSFSTLCQNVQNGNYTEGHTSLKTYLFEIGKRKACNWLRRNRMEKRAIPLLRMDYSQRDIPGVGRSPGNSRAAGAGNRRHLPPGTHLLLLGTPVNGRNSRTDELQRRRRGQEQKKLLPPPPDIRIAKKTGRR